VSAPHYVVAATHSWNRVVFEEAIRPLPGRWTFVSTTEQLEDFAASGERARYVFFLHWSWWVPAAITDAYECVVFHMTDVPYGRGGSPLQNLIWRGHTKTKLTALRMVEELDAGPVYAKEPLALDGTAREIYERASRLAAKMIAWMTSAEPEPAPQTGEPTVFRRRRPEESALPEGESAARLYDFIRMLDAPGYPHAFVRSGGHRIELTGAALAGEVLTAKATFVSVEGAR